MLKIILLVKKFGINLKISECHSIEKSPIGYFLEVNHKYSDELHELHNDYPLAVEKLAVLSDMLSKYCKKNADKYEIKVGDVKKVNSKFR